MNVLIEVDPLTDQISDFLQRELSGMIWDANIQAIVNEAIEFFNGGGMDAATDSIFEAFRKKGLWVSDNVQTIDNILDCFRRLFTFSGKPGSHVQVDYDSVSNTAIVKTVPVVVRTDAYLDNLKEDFNHALERSDFIPERLRRAFEEISR